MGDDNRGQSRAVLAPLFVLEAIRRHAPSVKLDDAEAETIATDHGAYFWVEVPHRDTIDVGEIYTTYVVHVTQGVAAVSHFRSRKGARSDSTLPPES